MVLPGEIPVTIITGFLGAGKTTLLNHILKEKGQKSVAVIENEFGEVNIDRELVAENLLEKEDLVSLQNGCVCCSLRKDIVKAFSEIERRNRTRTKKVDAIVLETTGLADPAPVAFTFFATPWIASRFRLDSIICVVDARYLMQSDPFFLDSDSESDLSSEEAAHATLDPEALTEDGMSAHRPHCSAAQAPLPGQAVSAAPQAEAPAQVHSTSSDTASAEASAAAAADHAAAEAKAAEAAAAQAAAGGAALPAAAHADQAAQRSCGEVGPASSASSQQQATALLRKYKPAGPSHMSGSKRPADGPPGSDCEDCAACSKDEVHRSTKMQRRPKRVAKRLHDLSDVSSVAIMAHGALDEYRFNMFMRDLLQERAKDIFRCKGVLCVHGYGNQKFVFQGVHETICYGPAESTWRDDEPRINQIVFIGRGLERKALIEGFRSCVWVPLPEGWQEFRDPNTKAPYYVNTRTGEKSWRRPEDIACARVVAVQGATQQPLRLLPRRQASAMLPSPSQAVNV